MAEMPILLRALVENKPAPVENGGSFHARAVLAQTSHRPYPLPAGPWIMTQRWHHLLFAHWSYDAETVRAQLPPLLRPYLETFDEKAWVGVIPFWMSHVHPRWIPPIPTASRFAEMNVRTYLNVRGIRGVYFFSLDAESRLAVQAARSSYHLNYQHARMMVSVEEEGLIAYVSRRNSISPMGRLEAAYRPIGPQFHPQPGTLEDFLTGRYCLYTCKKGTCYRANIHHLPWELQPAQAEFAVESMTLANRLPSPTTSPVLHYSEMIDVLVWLPEKVEL